MWIGSTMTLGPPSGGPTSLPNEAVVEVDWSLPLNDAGQEHFFNRIFADYERETLNMDLASKRRYRKDEADLTDLRILVGLWSQIHEFVKSQMIAMVWLKFEQDIKFTSRRDEELREIVQLQPKHVAMSHFASLREQAVKAKVEQDQIIASDMQEQYFELRDKKFNYFKNGLEHDWMIIDTVRGAMQSLSTVIHLKKVKWLKDLASKGDIAISQYMSWNIDVQLTPNLDNAVKVVAAKA